MTVNAAGIFVRGDDLEVVAALVLRELAAGRVPTAEREPLEDDDEEEDDDEPEVVHDVVLLEPLDGWVHLLPASRYEFERELARTLSAELATEVVGYALQGCNVAFTLGRWRSGALVEKTCSPAGLHDPETLAEVESESPHRALRFLDVEDLARSWLLDLGIPPARIYVRQEDLLAPEEVPAEPVQGVALDLVDGQVEEQPFQGRVPHLEGAPLRPDVAIPDRIVVDLFTLPCELDDEGAASLLRVFDRRARRYVLATGGLPVEFIVGDAHRPRLEAVLARLREAPGAPPFPFGLGSADG